MATLLSMCRQMDPAILVGIVGNVLSTVGVVIVNKYLWVGAGFKYMVTLSTFHFVFTSCSTRVLLRLGYFEDKPLNFWGVLPVCVGSCGSIVFMNLNLAWNSVGFYQISKLACIPLTLLLEYLMRGKGVSNWIKFSLFWILLGVGVATVSDMEMNFIGSVFATIAVIFTTLAQIFTSTRQKELGLDALQLLHQSGPFISIGMMLAIPFLDNVWTAPPHGTPLVQYEWNLWTLGIIFVTCLFALMVNITNYYVIGKTSPVTYQVVGHLKTCLILVLGFVAFSSQVNMTNIFGISIAVGGMVLYGELKRRENTPAPRPTNNVPLAVTIATGGRADREDGAISIGSGKGEDKEMKPLLKQ